MRSITSARGLLSRLRGVPDPPALRASARIFVVILVLFTLTRAVLTFRLETTGWSADPGGILVALVAGVGNDLGTALSMSALGYLLITLCGRRGLRSVAHLLLGLGLVVVVFGAVAEVFFWDEFASRLNGIAVFLWWGRSHRSIQAGLAGARWARHGGSWDKQLERERSYAGPSRSPAGADASGDASSAGS